MMARLEFTKSISLSSNWNTVGNQLYLTIHYSLNNSQYTRKL